MARAIRVGELVEVRSPAEIARTLDGDGTLEGLPFMPEMAELCGRRLRVLRRAEKTCVERDGGAYQIREFIGDDVFLLEGMRCSGAAHDGCQRACMFFWKATWLRTTAEDCVGTAAGSCEANALLHMLKTRSASGRYFCQSTELVNATRLFSRMRLLSKGWSDLRSGAVSVPEMCGLVAMPLLRKISDLLFGRRRVTGSLTRTPVGDLGLQPGELVEILPYRTIAATLDRKGRNRGLIYDIEVRKFSGRRYRVRNRLDRMISEPTGEMKNVQATVTLDGNTCMCARAIGGCPRLEFAYWREVWLKRAEHASCAGGCEDENATPCGGASADQRGAFTCK